jgi:hypothetical protein
VMIDEAAAAPSCLRGHWLIASMLARLLSRRFTPNIGHLF